MRRLNKKQKRRIDSWFNKNWKGAGSIGGIDDLPYDVYQELEDMNDFETIWQHTNNYIMEKALNA
jgi:hypothetical protein